MSGQLIVFEGPDHLGKSTQIELLKLHICNKYDNYSDYVFTREPGGIGIRIAEKIRSLILDPENYMHPITEAYLYAASRAEHCERIREWLAKGKTVICDRFVYSSYVYQGIARGLGRNVIENINFHAVGDLKVDKVIYLRADLDTYLKRKNNINELDRLEQNDIEFFKKVIQGYDELFWMPNLKVIDASQSREDIHKQIISHLGL